MEIDEKNLFIMRQLVSQAVGLPIEQCINAFDGRKPEDMPSGEYCAIGMSQTYAYGKAGVSKIMRDETMIRIVKQTKYFTTTFSFYRGDARKRASFLMGLHEDPDLHWLLFNNNMSIRRYGDIRNENPAELQNADYESRASMEVDFWYEEVTEMEAGYGDKVDTHIMNGDLE